MTSRRLAPSHLPISAPARLMRACRRAAGVIPWLSRIAGFQRREYTKSFWTWAIRVAENAASACGRQESTDHCRPTRVRSGLVERWSNASEQSVEPSWRSTGLSDDEDANSDAVADAVDDVDDDDN